MFYNQRDLHFLLYEVHRIEELTRFDYFADHDRESFDMVLEAAARIAEKMMLPLLTEMDRSEPQLVDGQIRVHAGMKAIMKKFGDDGWINACFPYDEGGQQLPFTIHNAAGFIFQAANYSASVYPYLSAGAANLIRTFGSPALIRAFTPKMYTGEWQGTMALTEPDAGSSLADLTTSATPTAKAGVFKLRGQKIFISCGDHDACENIVHLMLARIEGAPPGVRGISLFIVPKYKVDLETGSFSGQSNDVVTAGIYHKMGYKGAPIAHLMIGATGDCEGYLVGEPHQGLRYMFQMMNEARLGVGINAAAIGTAAYYTSLSYARERPQGRKVGEKDLSLPQTLIINHADVKRMLLFQKSIVEGALSLLLYCSKLADLANVLSGEERDRAALLLDLLTPVAKSYPSEMCCHTTSAAVQVLGGAGYTTEFPVEQFYREARIHPIHEGTTGIHGLDLLGRKIVMQDGRAARILFEEVSKTISRAAAVPELKKQAAQLQQALMQTQQVTGHLLAKAAGGELEAFLADATLYLELFGIMTLAWQWLEQGLAVSQKAGSSNLDFFQGKRMALRYFFEYELVKTGALSKRLLSDDAVTREMQAAWF